VIDSSSFKDGFMQSGSFLGMICFSPQMTSVPQPQQQLGVQGSGTASLREITTAREHRMLTPILQNTSPQTRFLLDMRL
jgi:hypothetical protein